MNALERVVVLATAMAFAGIGLWALFTPTAALGTVGVVPTNVAGVVELRAMYGGLELGAAAFLVWCALDESRIGAGLMATALLMGGLGLVRGIGVGLEGPEGWLMPTFTVLELTDTALAAALLFRRRKGGGIYR